MSIFELGSRARASGATAAPKEDVRHRLLTAALEIVYSEGLQALTQARVARQAGMRQSHLTYYFPTRSQLLTAVVEEAAQATLCTLGPDDAALPATLEGYLMAMADQLRDTRMPRLMMAMTLASEEDPSLKQWMNDFKSRALDRIHAALQHYGLDVGADQVALFHALLVGLAVLNLSDASEAAAEQSSRLFLLASQRLMREARLGRRRAVATQCFKGKETRELIMENPAPFSHDRAAKTGVCKK